MKKSTAPESNSAAPVIKDLRDTPRYMAPPSQRKRIGASKISKLKTDIPSLEHIVNDGNLQRFSISEKVSADPSWHVPSADATTADSINSRGR